MNKDDIIIESLEKGLDSLGIQEFQSFWSEKVNPNLSKFFSNKKILEAIDEVDKRYQKIEEKFSKKEDKEEKRKKMVAMHNEGKTKTSYKKAIGGNNSQFFNTPFVSEPFQNVIKESNEEEQKENISFALDNSSFTYKTEELDKSIVSVIRYKKPIIGYIDLDSLLQRIAMETPIFYDEDLNDYLLEGLGLQHTNFISTDIFMSKILSCFHFNYNRYLKSEKEEQLEEEQTIRSRTDNFCLTLDKAKNKKNRRIFIGTSTDQIEEINNNTIETFKDSEKRIPYGLINLIIIYVNTLQKYSITNISLDVASKILELFKIGLEIYPIKNIYESEIIKSKTYIQNMIDLSKETHKPKENIPFEKIYNIKGKNESFFNISEFSPKDIATELTRVSHLLFSKITPNEFFKGLFTKKDKEKTSPNICKVVERFNTISFWVIEEVLSFDYSGDRGKVIEQFIQISNELKNLNNFNDCMSIVSALGQMILTRLNKSWKKVSSKNMTILHKIKKLLNFQNNYKNIREEINKCLTEEKPFIPFLGYYTKRICFLEETGPYVNKSGLINVDKIAQVEQILSEFYDKNKFKYTFEISNNIKNKLSILQCLDPLSEEELEEQGNKIEPTFILCKKTNKKRITNTEKKFEENYKKKIIL